MRGDVPRSGDLSAAVATLAGVLMLGAVGPWLLGGLQQMTATMLGGAPIANAAALKAKLVGDIWAVIAPVAMLVAVVLIAAVLANVVQIGFLFTTQPVQADFARLSPAAGIKRFFSGRSAVRIAMSVAKITAVVFVSYLTIRPAALIATISSMSAARIVATAGEMIFALAVRVAGILLLLAILDCAYQRWQWRQELKMSRREVLEDLRRTEGDPLIRSRRRDVMNHNRQSAGASNA